MVQSQFNRYTRWFLLAVAIFTISMVLYVGKALATKPLPPASPPVSSESVTILPNRVIMPPDWQGASVQLTGYNVETAIKDNVATTTMVQTYHNPSSRTLEARYLFPLPKDANFSSMTLTVNGKALEGKILEKDQARQTYQEIVRKLIDPGLLEYLDDQTVQVSIAPFFAGESKEIRLSYTQLLSQDGGFYRYTYALGSQQAGSVNRLIPRPLPIRPMPAVRAQDKIAPASPTVEVKPVTVSLKLAVQTSQPLKTIYSPTHSPEIKREGKTSAQVTLALPPEQLVQEKQFVLYISQDNQAIALNALNYQRAGEDGYFLMTVRAPETVKAQTILPKDVVLVVDTSGSMSGQKMTQAKEALKYIINQLRPQDRFAVMQFNTDVSLFTEELVAADADQKQQALAWVDELRASGSTHIEAALKSGFGQLKNHDPKRPAYVIFLTDGEPTVGVTDVAGLVKVADAANTYQAKLFNFGVGYNLNAILLGKLSERHHGTTTFVEPNENLELALTSFYKKVESPVLTDARLDFKGVKVSKLYPETLGDLFAGNEVVLLGRYQGNAPGSVTLSGKMVGQVAQSFTLPIHWQSNTRHSQLPRLWAGRRIAYLLDAIRQNGENAESKAEIITLSKQYGIMTPYTSFLAVESEHQVMPAPAMGGGGRVMPPGRGYTLNQGAAPSMPMSSRAAMDASSGQGAVQLSKSLNAMKTQASASALNAAQAPGASLESRMLSSSIKTVGEKTFVLSKEGIWTDTAYNAQKDAQPIKIAFGSDAYFKLLNERPELQPYFSLGEQVIVVLEDVKNQRQVYQVTTQPHVK